MTKTRFWPPLVFLASAAAALLTAALNVRGIPFLRAHGIGFFDLRVYRESVVWMLHGRPLYRARFQAGYGFTYPPAAALAILPLADLPMTTDAFVVTLLNVALIAVIAHAATGLAGPPADHGARASRARSGWLSGALVLWSQPVVSALGYGQIDIVVAALVVADLGWWRDRSWGGLGIGAAAALKLTPLVFVPYLLLGGHRRMGLRAVGAFLAAIACAWVAAPGDSRSYFTGAIFDTSRVTGNGRFAGRGLVDQSLHGLLLRLAPSLVHAPGAWLGICAACGVAGIALAVRAARRREAGLGFALTAVTGLLISPISWTHHWTAAMPALVYVLGRPGTRRSLRAAAAVAMVATSALQIEISRDGAGTHLTPAGSVLGDLYVLAGLGLIAAAAARDLRPALAVTARRRALRPSPSPAVSPGHPGVPLRGGPPGAPSVARAQSRA